MSATKDFNPGEVVKCLHIANQLAYQHHHQYVTLEHLLAALLEQPDVQEVMAFFNVEPSAIRSQIDDFFAAGFLPEGEAKPVETDLLSNSVRLAVSQVMFSNRHKAMPVDLLVGILQQQESPAAAFLHNYGINSLELKKYLSHGEEADVQRSPVGVGGDGMPVKEIKTREDAEDVLGKYCTNLNEQATEAKIDPLIGRADEVEQVLQITARRTKNNCVLVGESGVGKTQLVEGLALKIVRQEVPEVIADAVIYAMDVGALIAGTRFRGDFEERVKQVLKALTFIEKPMLFIDEIHTIMGAGSGSQGSLDVANLLKPALQKGHLRCIGATTYEEYRKHFEKDRALLRRFKKVDVPEPSIADAKAILRGLRSYYEEFHSLQYTDASLDAAVDLTARYVQNQCLPDKAIDVIDNAGARQRIAVERKPLIDVDDIEFEVSKIAKIPPQTVAEDEREKLKRLMPDMQQMVFGQSEALQTLTDAVQMSRAGLREPNKPAGSYLFAGPTGTGKTELARQLAKTLGIPLTKFDMSEYMEKHSVAKLIGSPPGYVGYGEGGAGAGLLTNAIETTPHCVLLLDEVEKAHPDVFNILLQVMDDARLTNSNGKTVNFGNVFLIMSTNAGAAEMARHAMGFGEQQRDEDDEAIKRFFAPEFRNRLDAVVKFNRLRPADMERVVEKYIAQLNEIAAPKGIVIDLAGTAKQWLARKGYDPEMGARPLARVITEHVKQPLARLMLFGELVHGGRVSIVCGADDKLELVPQLGDAAAA